jgi:hypothetical protein
LGREVTLQPTDRNLPLTVSSDERLVLKRAWHVRGAYLHVCGDLSQLQYAVVDLRREDLWPTVPWTHTYLQNGQPCNKALFRGFETFELRAEEGSDLEVNYDSETLKRTPLWQIGVYSVAAVFCLLWIMCDIVTLTAKLLGFDTQTS